MDTASPSSILITGASSGIGAALAEVYAAPGISLFLSGRNVDRLEAVAARCRNLGAEANIRPLDVTDKSAMEQWIAACDAMRPLDVIIANAGISGGQHIKPDSAANTAAERIHAVNVEGVKNTVEPVIPRMTARGRGQIAIISSLAGLRPLSSAPAYSASKVAVREYGEKLCRNLQSSGVQVSVVLPGFVESRITADNPFHMPMLMEAPRAAQIIREGLARKKARIAFPLPMYAMMWAIAALPRPLGDLLLAGLPKKE